MCAILVLWLLLVRIGNLERRYAEDLGFFSTFFVKSSSFTAAESYCIRMKCKVD